MQAARLIQKNAAILRHGRLVLKEILKAGQAGFARMHALHRLRQLHLIADQHDVRGSARHGDEIAERYLARFIDEQIVICPALVFAAEMKHRAADEPMLRRSIFRVKDRRDVEAVEFGLGLVLVAFLRRR